MRRESSLFCAALCLLLLPACAALPAPREAENMRPVQVLGVDAAETGVTVTAIAATRADTKTYSATADTVAAACAAIQAEATDTLFYGHAEQILAGEDLAARGLEELLTYVVQERELRLDAALFIVKSGTAAEAITGPTVSVPKRLAALAGQEGACTVGGVLADLSRQGQAAIPALSLYKEGNLMRNGYAVLRDDVLAGWRGE